MSRILIACAIVLAACGHSKPAGLHSQSPSSGSPTPVDTTPAACEPAVALFIAKVHFSAGESVPIALNATNRTPRPCLIEESVCIAQVSVQDDKGNVVWSSRDPKQACPRSPRIVTIETQHVESLHFEWNQRQCFGDGCATGAQVAGGTYTVIGRWAALGLPNYVDPVDILIG